MAATDHVFWAVTIPDASFLPRIPRCFITGAGRPVGEVRTHLGLRLGPAAGTWSTLTAWRAGGLQAPRGRGSSPPQVPVSLSLVSVRTVSGLERSAPFLPPEVPGLSWSCTLPLLLLRGVRSLGAASRSVSPCRPFGGALGCGPCGCPHPAARALCPRASSASLHGPAGCGDRLSRARTWCSFAASAGPLWADQSWISPSPWPWGPGRSLLSSAPPLGDALLSVLCGCPLW